MGVYCCLPSNTIFFWGIAEEGLKMQPYDPAYNWVIFLMLNAVSTALFSVLQMLLILAKIQILRKI